MTLDIGYGAASLDCKSVMYSLKQHKALATFIVAVAMLACAKCTLPITSWSYEASAPDGTAAAMVRTRGFKPHVLEVVLKQRGDLKIVFRKTFSEVYVGFCEIHWSPDSRIVSVFATNPLDGHDTVFAFDTLTEKPADPNWAAQELRSAIGRKYPAAAVEQDPLRWAHTQHAQDLFHAMTGSK